MWTFSALDAQRVSRDLAYAELSAMPGIKQQLGTRLHPRAHGIDWGNSGLAVDSLARMTLATAAATWCNAYDSGHADLFLARKTTADWAQAMLQARSQGAKQFTFSTSGSTGERKHVRHQEALLWQEAQGWAAQLGELPQAPKRVVVCCPVHHIYGFIWGVMLPLALGVPVVELAWDEPLAVQSGDVVIAVPTQWAWWAQTKLKWPPHVTGISSTGPLSPTAAAAAGQAGLARFWGIYGSTETGGLGWRSELPPDEKHYQLAPCKQRQADTIACEMPNGSLAKLDVQDQLNWLDSPSDNLSGKDRFEVVGRLDGVVQVAGHNVSPDAVARQLRSHPAVKDAAVRLGNINGEPRLKAFVVLTEAAAQQTDAVNAVEQWMLATLSAPQRPAHITYGAALPQTEFGKATDW